MRPCVLSHGCAAQICYFSMVSTRQRIMIRLKHMIVKSLFGWGKTIMGKYFGTDGFRGEAGVNLTADHAYKVGRFLGWYYNALRERNGNNEPARIVIGKDTRRSSYMFEYSLVARFDRLRRRRLPAPRHHHPQSWPTLPA